MRPERPEAALGPGGFAHTGLQAPAHGVISPQERSMHSLYSKIDPKDAPYQKRQGLLQALQHAVIPLNLHTPRFKGIFCIATESSREYIVNQISRGVETTV